MPIKVKFRVAARLTKEERTREDGMDEEASSRMSSCLSTGTHPNLQPMHAHAVGRGHGYYRYIPMPRLKLLPNRLAGANHTLC